MPPIEPSRYADGVAKLLAGIRRWHQFTDADVSIPSQWQEFQRLVPLSGQIGAAAYGVVCASEPERQRFEYLCACEVGDFAALPPDLGRLRLPAQHYAVFTHRGHVTGLRGTWDAIWHDWLPRSGRRPANTPDFELYDGGFDARSGSGVIEIWFPLAAPGAEEWTHGAPGPGRPDSR